VEQPTDFADLGLSEETVGEYYQIIFCVDRKSIRGYGRRASIQQNYRSSVPNWRNIPTKRLSNKIPNISIESRAEEFFSSVS